MLEFRNVLSSTPTPTPEEILAALIPILSASNTSKYAGTAVFVIFSYDHVLTLSDEVWRSDAIADTVLHKQIHSSLGTNVRISSDVSLGLSPEFCTRSVRGIWIVTVTAMLVAQAVLVLRIWYLF
ncbi:hypothetical protein FIBSPDRAFT_954127 [Athelia psychrophila]|uniref:Uncharacterized protein n=1 Tax=Athelia psychrophila TaxID=1759441 RepID=A0A166JJZ0_9AGAM|nr:hypothetical protein FIBSPDRAFT_954127 [Fibularhizoctonia sp. CBS 109695]